MTRFSSDQLAFARTQTRYLGRADAIAFLQTMDIKMSVGHWSAGDFCDRFAPPGYHSDDPRFKGGIKLAIEPKPYEPRELYMIIPTAASAILVAQRVNQLCGGTNCGLTIDYGHQKMEGTTASTACDLAAYAGVPVHKFDINDARQGRNDQDCMFGTLSSPESVEYLFTTFVRDYRGYYSQDQFTYRDDPTRAMERSMVNFANLALKAVRVLEQRSALDKARAAGTGPDVLDIVSPILVG